MRPLRPVAIWLGRQEATREHAHVVVRVDRALTRLSRGRMPLLRLAGLDELTLHVPGRRTGVERSTPLLCVPFGRGFVIIGSNWGNDRPPVWVGNLRAAADGTVAVTIDGERSDVTVTELEGSRREAAWRAAVRAWPNYEVYVTRTDRRLPVFLLEPRGIRTGADPA